MPQRLAVILGPTATGKSHCAIELAKRMNGEIISGDSMLVYRGMDIGTAKPSLTEREGIPHHLIDILDPYESFNVMEFKSRAAALIEEINARGKLPIIAGGTVLYIKALLEDYQFAAAESDIKLRTALEKEAAMTGEAALYAKLVRLDPHAAANIHPHNVRRVIRALEVAMNGETVSSASSDSVVYNAVVFGLHMERELLYERINRRVNIMAAAGLADEVKKLLNDGADPEWQSMQGIGYRQMVWHCRGGMSLEEALDKVKQATRNFAKRQQTWYKKLPYVQWFSLEEQTDYADVVAAMERILVEKFK